MDITGSSAIVTGGASGIGAAVARALAARGAIVVVADLNAEKGEALASEIGGVFAGVDDGGGLHVSSVPAGPSTQPSAQAIANGAPVSQR